MSTILTDNFIYVTRMLFNTGYTFLTCFVYPGFKQYITPLVLLLLSSLIIFTVKWLKKVLSEV